MSIFSFFTRKSVDGIVSDIITTVERLEDAVIHHNTKGSAQVQAATDANAAADQHFAEANRAVSISNKLKELIS